ncbi:MAG: alpha-hydroxy acid oxidase [Pseudomonadota bacterium]
MASPAINLHDFEALARDRLDPAAFDYIAGGAGDEGTLAANRAAWDAICLVPRVLRDVSTVDTGIECLGRRWPHPLWMAPMAWQRMAHPHGEAASALAAAAQGAGFVLAEQAGVSIEEIGALVRDEPGRGPLTLQMRLHHDRGFDLALTERARAAGFDAIVLTLDSVCNGARDRERRGGFAPPPGVTAVNLADLPPPPADAATHPAMTWNDLDWLLGACKLPVLVKGLLHPADAKQAAAAGVAAIVVSNHGGRTLDSGFATARALPRIADAVAGSVPLLVDGGIRRGTDVLKALALGARAVLVGRPLYFALAAAGPQGVAQALRLLRDELEIAMVLAGCATTAQAGPDLLDRPA